MERGGLLEREKWDPPSLISGSKITGGSAEMVLSLGIVWPRKQYLADHLAELLGQALGGRELDHLS